MALKWSRSSSAADIGSSVRFTARISSCSDWSKPRRLISPVSGSRLALEARSTSPRVTDAQAQHHGVERQGDGQGDVAAHHEAGGEAGQREDGVADGERQAEEEAGGDGQEAGEGADRQRRRHVGCQHHTGDDDDRRLQDGDVERLPRPARSPAEDDATGGERGHREAADQRPVRPRGVGTQEGEQGWRSRRTGRGCPAPGSSRAAWRPRGLRTTSWERDRPFQRCR